MIATEGRCEMCGELCMVDDVRPAYCDKCAGWDLGVDDYTATWFGRHAPAKVDPKAAKRAKRLAQRKARAVTRKHG